MKLDRSSMQAWALASEVGCSIAFFLGASVVGGVLLDRQFGTAPVFLLIGIFLGLFLAGYSIYRLAAFRTVRVKHTETDTNDQQEPT